MKTRFVKPLKTKELERGTKRYQERIVEQHEAEREIKEYQHTEKEILDNDERPTIPEFIR